MPFIPALASLRLPAFCLLIGAMVLLASPLQAQPSFFMPDDNAAADRAATDTRTGRYARTRSTPTTAQHDPLSALVEARLSGGMHTLGEAFESLLRGTGYLLVARPPRDMQLLLSRQLAVVHRFLGPISVRSALRTLAGPQWDLVEDPVHRLVAFELLAPWSEHFLSAQEGAFVPAGEAGIKGVTAEIERVKFVAPLSPVAEMRRLFRVRKGSLRANVERVVALWDWQMVGWELTLNDGVAVLDWQLHTDWMLSARDLAEALREILLPHGLYAVLHARDGTVSVHRMGA